MMKYMRHGALSGFFAVFLVLGGVSIVLTDWTGSFRGGVTSRDVATIAGTRISAPEFNRIVQRQLRGAQIDPAQAFQMGLVDEILTNEISGRQLSLAAAGYGLVIGDDLLLARLKALVAEAQKSDPTPPSLMLRRFIESQGLDEASYLALLRRSMSDNLLRQALTAGTDVISPLLAADLAAYQAETRDFDVLILPNAAQNVAEPDAPTVAAYYEAQKTAYQIPERRSFRLARLTKADLEARAAVTDEQIHAFYDKNKASMIQPERRTLAQAVFAPGDAKSAQDFLAALPPGADLIKAAGALDKKLNVTANAQDFEQAGLLPELADPAFSAPEGALVGPIQTSLGWHVVRVVKIYPESPLPLADAKEKIRAQLQSEALDTAIGSLMDTLDQAYESHADFASVAKESGMSVLLFAPLTREGKTADNTDALKDFADVKAPILESAFSLAAGELSPPLELANGDLVILSVDRVTPAAARPLAEIRKELEDRWISEQRQQKTLATAGALLSDIKNGKTTLTAIAEDKGLTVSTTFKARRKTKDLPANLTRAAWMNLFSAKIGDLVLQPVEGGVMLASVTAAHLPEAGTPPDAEIFAAQTDSLKKAQTDETLTAYLGVLGQLYPAEINKRLLKQLYARQGEDTAPDSP